jgi:hypothetical protein
MTSNICSLRLEAMRYSVDFRKKVMEFADTHTIQETSNTFKTY